MSRLRIGTIEREGELVTFWLAHDDGRVSLVVEERGGELPSTVRPEGFLVALFERYGKPFDQERVHSVDPNEIPLTLATGETLALRAVRFLGFGDVVPNDYVVLAGEGFESLATPAPLFTAALAALVRAQKKRE